MKNDYDYAVELIKNLPKTKYEVCVKHQDENGFVEVHIHKFCNHGNMVGDWVVKEEGLFSIDGMTAWFGREFQMTILMGGQI